jgi:alpha-glucosidase
MQDPQGLNINPDKSRDPCRTPFQWSDAPYAGFSTVEPWLPVAGNYRKRNIESQKRDSMSLLTLYRRLLHLRQSSLALTRGRYSPVNDAPLNCFVYLREYEQERYLIALNFGAEFCEVEFHDATGKIVLSTELDRAEGLPLSALSLRPHEGILVELSANGL